MIPRPPISTLFPYTTLFRSDVMTGQLREARAAVDAAAGDRLPDVDHRRLRLPRDRKSTRLNSSHVRISYAVFCLKKKKKTPDRQSAEHCTCRRSSRISSARY